MNIKSALLLLLVSTVNLTIYSASEGKSDDIELMALINDKPFDKLMPDAFRGRTVRSLEHHERISPYFDTVMLAPPAKLTILKHCACGLVEVEQGAEKLAALATLRDAGKIRHEILVVSNCHGGEKIHTLLVNITAK